MINWRSYKGKTVLVTGASTGIGKAMAEYLAAQKAIPILVARSKDKLDALAEKIQSNGGEAHVFAEDLSVPGSAEKLYNAVTEAGLSVDLLVNNAGYGRWGAFMEHEPADYTRMIQLNITTLTELCHLFLGDMLSSKSGGIINVASIASFGPVPYGNVYSSTKAYVLTFSEALSFEYKDKGVHVMALCPGATESEFMKVATEKSEEARKNADKISGSMIFQSSEEVAKECFDAFLRGEIYHITGMSNRVAMTATKFLPRSLALSVVGSLFKKVVKG